MANYAIDPSLLGGDPSVDPNAAPQDSQAPSDGNPVDLLRSLLNGAMEYMGVEQDEEDKAAMADIISRIQKLLAVNQQQQDQMMGANPAAKGLRKQFSNQ